MTDIAEKELTNTEGLPEGTTKVVLVEQYNLEDKKIYTTIFELRDTNNAMTEIGQRSIMFSNTPAIGEEPAKNYYDEISVMINQERIDKIATDNEWI